MDGYFWKFVTKVYKVPAESTLDGLEITVEK